MKKLSLTHGVAEGEAGRPARFSEQGLPSLYHLAEIPANPREPAENRAG